MFRALLPLNLAFLSPFVGPLLLAGCSHSSHSRSDTTSAAAPPAAAVANAKADGDASSSVVTATATTTPESAYYAGQKTCPVTGAALGSMGPAVPVDVGGMRVYVCCQACITKVQSDPAQYVLKVEAERAGPPDRQSSGSGCCKTGGGTSRSGGGCCGH